MNIFYLILGGAADVAGQPAHNIVKVLIVILVIALLIGLIRILCLKGQLTSVHRSESAADYTRDNSFSVQIKRDLFLYSKTDKTEKPQTSDSSK